MSDAAAGSTGAEPAEPAAVTDPAAVVTPSPADAAAAAGASPAAASAAGAAAGAGGQQLDTTGWPAEAVTAYERAKADAAKYQREAGDSRMNAKRGAAADATKAAVKAINDVLGVETPDDSQLTLEQVTEAVTKTRAELAAERRARATVVEAWAQGIDPAKLGYLQYQLSTDANFGALDTTDADFSAKLTSSIAALVAKDSTLKLPVGAVASGVESLGGAGGATAITPEAFAAMSIEERTNLYKTDKATYDKLVGNAS